MGAYLTAPNARSGDEAAPSWRTGPHRRAWTRAWPRPGPGSVPGLLVLGAAQPLEATWRALAPGPEDRGAVEAQRVGRSIDLHRTGHARRRARAGRPAAPGQRAAPMGA